MRILFCSVALLALQGCVHRPLSRFTPYASDAVGLATVTYPAVLAYHGDIAALTSAGGRVLGWERTRDTDATKEAARYGATHVVAVGAMVNVLSGTGCSAAEPGPACANVTIGPSRPGEFTLFRVEPERWPELPAQLRPAARFDGLPADCECSHEDRNGDTELYEWFIHCKGAVRAPTPQEESVYCRD